MSMVRYVFIFSADKGKADCGKAVISSRITEYCELVRKNEAAIKSFLGTHRITSEIVVFPAYYGELLAWACKRYMEREHWQTAGIIGYHYSEPVYANVSTDYHETERVVVDGQLLVDSRNHRLLVTVDARGCPRSQVRVEGSTKNKCEIKEFACGIKTIAEKENYYRHNNISFNGRIQFMDICDEAWRNIILAPVVKEQIKASIIDLLGKKQIWTKYGLPLKRCILLTGGEDKDKKAICRALMAEAVGITCIITNARNLDYDCAVQLYDLARDLSPCIVFVEDIDHMGQNRIKCDYYRVPSVLYLLTILASVENYEEIVTVATASYENAVVEAMLC
jgi:cell division protease FtsH